MPEPSYVSGPSDRPLLGLTIGAQLERTATAFPDVEAIVARHQGRRVTYAELRVEVTRAARALLALGVAPGDRVGIWSPNRIEWAVVQYATAQIGAILVNVNPAYRVHELRHALGAAGVRTLVSARGFHAADYVALGRRGARRPARPAGDSVPRRRGRASVGTHLVGDARPRGRGHARGAAHARGGPRPGRCDQHPVHVRDDRAPEGRDAHAPQRAEQRRDGGEPVALRTR